MTAGIPDDDGEDGFASTPTPWPQDRWAEVPGDLLDPAPGLFAFLDAARAVTFALDAGGTDARMTAVQARLASQLLESPCGLPLCELADRLGISRPAVTQTVRRMISRKLLSLEEPPLDGRTKLVVLTDHGIAQYRSTVGVLQGFEARLALAHRDVHERGAVHTWRSIVGYFGSGAARHS